MKKLTVDTNAFLRFILQDIPEQADEVEELFKKAQLKKIELFVPQIVIFEILHALEKYYSFPKNTVIEKLSSVISAKYLMIQNRILLKKALEIFKQKNLDLADCFIFAYSEDKNAELFTFDKALKKLK